MTPRLERHKRLLAAAFSRTRIDAVFDTGIHAVEVEMPLNPGGFMGSQRLAFWLRKLGWRGESSRREPDPIEMGTAFGLDASMGPVSDWSDSSTVGFVDGGLQSAPPRY